MAPLSDCAYEPLPLFDELADDMALVTVLNAVQPPAVVDQSPIQPPAVVVGILSEQEIGDAAEYQFASHIIERHGTWQKASTDAQPHDCLVILGGERSLVQVKGSQTQQRQGFYAVDLGARRIDVEAFALMIRHEGLWLPPFIIPAGTVRKRRYLQVWPTYRWLRRGTFDTARWRGAWWVIDPAERTERQREALLTFSA